MRPEQSAATGPLVISITSTAMLIACARALDRMTRLLDVFAARRRRRVSVLVDGIGANGAADRLGAVAGFGSLR